MSEPHDFASGSIEFGAKVAIERGNAALAAPLMDKSGVPGAGVEAIQGDVMKRAHREKLQLCDALENIADALPSVDRLKCLGTANAILPLLRKPSSI